MITKKELEEAGVCVGVGQIGRLAANESAFYLVPSQTGENNELICMFSSSESCAPITSRHAVSLESDSIQDIVNIKNEFELATRIEKAALK